MNFICGLISLIVLSLTVCLACFVQGVLSETQRRVHRPEGDPEERPQLDCSWLGWASVLRNKNESLAFSLGGVGV